MVEKSLERESDDVIVGESRRTETIYSTNRYVVKKLRGKGEGKEERIKRGY